MVKPYDLSKIKKQHNKKRNVKDGFNDPITWIDTGNKALNRRISGDFNKGIPLGGVTVFAGESGSGKSYIVSGNIVRNALEQDINVIVMDSEDALYQKWISRLGVNPDHPKLVRYSKSTINELVETINDFTEEYRKDNFDVPREEQPKILFVVDSLGFVGTEAEVEQFSKNELKGDKGIKAKSLKMFVGNCIRLFAGYQIGLVATNHTYKSQDMYNPDDVISGGSGFIYASSVVISMNKKKLKAEEDDSVAATKTKKPKAVVGIIASVKCVKTRFSKPFEEVDIAIPYSTGMDPYSGLFEMFKKEGILVQEGAYYSYTKKDGEKVKLYRKDMDTAFFDMIINEFPDDDSRGFDFSPDMSDEEDDNE